MGLDLLTPIRRKGMQRVESYGVFIGLLWAVFWFGIALADDARPPFSIADANWRTDFSRHTVPVTARRFC